MLSSWERREVKNGLWIIYPDQPDTKLKWGYSHVTFAINSSTKIQKRQQSHWRFHNFSPKLLWMFLDWKKCYALLTHAAVRQAHVVLVLGIPLLYPEMGIWVGTKYIKILNSQYDWACQLLRKSSLLIADLSSSSPLVSEHFVALRSWWYLKLKSL